MELTGFIAGVIVALVMFNLLIFMLLGKLAIDIFKHIGAFNGFVANTVEKLYKIEQVSMATMQASEQFIDALEKAAGDGTGLPTTPPAQTFRTADGKHFAHTIEEFIKKLESDPEYQSLAQKIKEDLENAIGEFNDDDDDEDDKNNPF